MSALQHSFKQTAYTHSNMWLRSARTLIFVALAITPFPARAQTDGITVGHAKVYDNQSLTIMLESLNSRLQQIQVIDQPSLMKALGMQQGSQQQDVSRSFNFSATAPSVAAAATPAPAAAAPPALPDLMAAPNYQPPYGENSGDLLSDQVDLTYQIFNLRMLLERSITDRLNGAKPRRQAVIGFNITLDPPSNAKDAAAYVVITLSTPAGPIELVASMPQEKTYNASALSSSSNSFGGSAVAKVFTVGYSQRNRHQTFFLYRDSDTLAIERPSDANATTFGWVFRPVLGRRSVSSGMRQLFAIVALPDTDSVTDSPQSDSQLTATVKTYWLHYTRSTSTTVVHPGFWDWSANHLPPKGIPTTLPTIIVPPTKPVETNLHPIVSSVELFPTTDGNTVLQIEGDNFFTGTTVTIGDKTYQTPADGLFLKSSQTMIVTASADVLSRSMEAVVNGRYGKSTPLYTKPTQEISITSQTVRPLDSNFTSVEIKIRNADPALPLTRAMISSYPEPYVTANGTTVPYRPSVQDLQYTQRGKPTLHYLLVSVTVPNSMLQARDNRVGVIFPLMGRAWHQEVAVYDDSAVQVTQLSTGKNTTLLISKVGSSFNTKWRLILDKEYPITYPPAAVSTDPKKTDPPSLTSITQCGDPDDTIHQCFVLKLVADTQFLKDYKQIALITDTGFVETVDLPAASAAAAAEKPATPPEVKSVTPPAVGFNEVVTVTISGTGLDAVKQVSFDGKPLTFWTAKAKDATATKPAPSSSPATAAAAPATPHSSTPPKSGDSSSDSSKTKVTEIRVLLSRAVTSKEGHQELLLQVDSKTYATVTITVSPGPTPAKSEGTQEKKSQ